MAGTGRTNRNTINSVSSCCRLSEGWGAYRQSQTLRNGAFKTIRAGAQGLSIPIIQVFKQHPKNIVLAIGARLAETVSSNIINAFGMAYITTTLLLDKSIPLVGMMVASAIGIFMCPVYGYLSDRIGQRKIYLFGAGFCVLFAYPFFLLLNTGNPVVIVMALIVAYNLGPTSMFAVQPTMFSKMFGARVRYTGLSFAYQFSAILGGLTPLISSTLYSWADRSYYLVAGYLVLISLIAVISVLGIQTVKNV